jgi:transcriptional regulator with XRE-family HTH domain
MERAARDLSEYVKRVMKLKGLTQKDVEQMSDGRITGAYVGSITTGRAGNPSVEKIKALAAGLGVDVDDLFHVACGLPEELDGQPEANRAQDALMILETVQKAVMSPEVIEILHEVVRLSPEERADLLMSVRRVAALKKSRRKNKRTQAP